MTQRLFLVGLIAVAGCFPEAEPPEVTGPTGHDPDSPRVVDGLQVLYTFDEGQGLDVKDRSGVEPAFDLHLDNLVTNQWVAGGGIDIVGTSVITSPEVADKVFAACVQNNAVTLEVWAEPASIDQQGTLFTYSKQGRRNATLSVNATRYAGQVLTATPDPAMPGEMLQNIETVQTPDNKASVTVQHVVFTRDADGSALYLDGVDTKPPADPGSTPTMPKPIADETEWSPTYQLALGNESTGGSPWLGRIYMAAIYCRKLTAPEVAKNYTAGY